MFLLIYSMQTTSLNPRDFTQHGGQRAIERPRPMLPVRPMRNKQMKEIFFCSNIIDLIS